MQILQFILQIKQREVKFSGMGLFYFGNNFVRKVCFLNAQVHLKTSNIQSKLKTLIFEHANNAGI